MDSEGQPVSQQSMKKGKNDTNASASPIPREPFDLAQLKAYGKVYSCNNITTTLIQISRIFYFGFFSKTNHQMMI